MNGPVVEVPGLGGSLALYFLSLGVVCLAAYGLLRWMGRRGIGRGTGVFKIVGRCVLEPRRTVYLIAVAERCFMVGVGDGAMTLLAELDAAAVAKSGSAEVPGEARSWGAAFAKVRKATVDIDTESGK
jgi:flagellar biogenesis protein FliO